jgi:hypothetical protein
MAYIASPRFWAFLVAGIWALIWAIGASAFVFSHNYDALWILGIFSTPSSLVVSGLSHALGDVFGLAAWFQLLIDLCGFLLLGSAQYAAIGYVFGMGVRKVIPRRETVS